jgi:AraC-like DNA-binding protein
MYRDWPSSVPHTTVWVADPSRHEQHRVLPDGCMDLIWYDDQLLVAGPDTHAQIAEWWPSRRYVGLRFGAGIGPRVFGVPGHILRDERVLLSEVWSAALVRRLTDQLTLTANPAAVLERAAAEAMRRAEPPDPLGAHLVNRVARDDRVADIADDVGLSVRQLHRRSLDAIGYGPKTLARIVRMTRALDLARTGVGFSEVAARAGYADQAHLSRDVKSLAGVPITSLVPS